MNPLCRFPSAELTMPLSFLPSAPYFATLAQYGRVVIEDNALFDKRQKHPHRYAVADVNGPMELTVPIVKPHGIPRATWRHVGISPHNQWWHIHRVTLESAYGRTPFFEFYIDNFTPFLSAKALEFSSVAEMNMQMLRTILPLLSIDTEVVAASSLSPREFECIKKCDLTFREIAMPPYWQVRAASQGFIPNLCILDLLFNLGPEAPLYLESLLKQSGYGAPIASAMG